MDKVILLVAASASISESTIRRSLANISHEKYDAVHFADGNLFLKRVIHEKWPGARSVAAQSPVSARKAVSDITHLVLLWDGEHLTDLLFESRVQKKATKLIAVQVTRIVNKKSTDNFDVYIGRGSPWGNPFAIGHGDGPDRAEVIEKYKEYFDEKIATDPSFRRGILGMRGLRLACFCKPLACHGDVIAKYLDDNDCDPT